MNDLPRPRPEPAIPIPIIIDHSRALREQSRALREHSRSLREQGQRLCAYIREIRERVKLGLATPGG